MTGSPLDQAFRAIDASAPEAMDFLGPVPEHIVVRAEAFLGIRLPTSYRSFVLRYGQGFAGPYEIYGLRADEPVPETATLNFVDRTLDARRYGLPADMVAVYNLGNGEDYVLDLSRGEDPPMLAWSPAAGGDRTRMDLVEPSFGVFLLEKVRLAAEEATAEP
jgi:hypothetical protein